MQIEAHINALLTFWNLRLSPGAKSTKLVTSNHFLLTATHKEAVEGKKKTLC